MTEVKILAGLAIALLGWGAQAVAKEPQDWLGWLAVTLSLPLTWLVVRLLLEEQGRQWLSTLKLSYSPQIQALGELLGEPYAKYRPAADGWRQLKADAAAGDTRVRAFLLALGVERAQLNAITSAISGVYEQWDALLASPLYGGAFAKWLRGQWRNGHNHDEVLRLWVFCECARAERTSEFLTHRRIIRFAGGLSANFMEAARGQPSEGIEDDG